MSDMNVNGTIKSTGGGDSLLNTELIKQSGANYIRYYSGLQICWGYIPQQNGVDKPRVTYQMPFLNNEYSLVAKRTMQSGGGTDWDKSQIKSQDNTGFVFSDQAVAARVNWIAIGDWK